MLTCNVCGSPDWFAIAPGTASDATRFECDTVEELRPTGVTPTRVYCLPHWRQSWTPAPSRPPETDTDIVGQADWIDELEAEDRWTAASAAITAEIGSGAHG